MDLQNSFMIRTGFLRIAWPVIALIILLNTSVSPLFAEEECLKKAKKHFISKDYKKVIMSLNDCKKTPKAHQLLGVAYFELNYMEDAKEHLKKAIDHFPDNVQLKIKYANAFSQNREFRKGVKEFRKLIKKYPDHRDVRKGLAQALGWNREYEEAIAEYKKLVKENKKDFDSRIQIARLLSWDKKFKKSVELSREILSDNPPDEFEIRARLNLAEVLSWMKKLDESLSEYNKAIETAPKNPKGYLGKGQVLEWQGKYKAAIKAYEEALQVSPGNKKAQARLQQLMWVE